MRRTDGHKAGCQNPKDVRALGWGARRAGIMIIPVECKSCGAHLDVAYEWYGDNEEQGSAG
jgi:hypothetical protein